ncbi:MAG: hypothetical protein ABIP94_24200 [Planctomycetota bacterium]
MDERKELALLARRRVGSPLGGGLLTCILEAETAVCMVSTAWSIAVVSSIAVSAV